MAVPLHAHASDGSYYSDCGRCLLERAAPDMLAALQRLDTVTLFTDGTHSQYFTFNQDDVAAVKAAIALAQGNTP